MGVTTNSSKRNEHFRSMRTKPKTTDEPMNPAALLFNGGIMGEAVRAKDWSKTTLGPLDTWPERLLVIVNTIMESKFPYFLFWGLDYKCFFNDGYLPSLGQHFDYNEMLGKPGIEFWSKDVWENVALELIQTVLSGRNPEWNVDRLVPIYRNGVMEDVYWTFTYSPVRDKKGSIDGVLVTCMETTEKVGAYDELKTSRDQLHFALEAASLATFEWLPKEQSFTGNKLFREWFGQEPLENMDTEDLFAAVHPDDRDRVRCAVDQALNPHMSPNFNMTYAVGAKGEQPRVVLVTGKVVFNEQQEPIRFNGVLQDITKKWIIEQEQKKLLTLFDTSSELILLTNEQGIITHYNPSALSYLGIITLNETRLLDYIHKDDWEEASVLINNLRSRCDISLELRLINAKDATQTWVIANFSVIKNTATGELIALAITGSNITALKEKEQLLFQYNTSLKESEDRFKQLADRTPAFIFMTDADHKFTFVNSPWASFLSNNTSTMLGQTLDTLVHSDDYSHFKSAYNQAAITTSSFKMEYRIKNHNGSYLWVSHVGVPRYDLDGNFEGYTNAAMNIQDLKTQEEQKDLFIGVASHELNTPVTTIKGYVQLLQMKYGASEDHFLRKSIATMDSQVSLLTSLIKDLLDLSKMKSGGLELQKTTFDFYALIQDVVEQQQIINASHAYKITGDLNLKIHADKERLKQVLLNFLTNAVKYAPQSNTIDLHVDVANDKIRVSVKDYGIGIHKLNEDKVFNRFFREEGSDEKTFPGFGIGLFIAADIIRKHEGTIGVNSTKGAGSTFYFTIPI